MNDQQRYQIIREARAYWDGGEPLEAGKTLFETIPVMDRPAWAVDVLAAALKRFPLLPPIEAILEFGRVPELWPEDRCRDVLLLMSEIARIETRLDTSQQSAPTHWLVELAYEVTKTIYTARQYPAPFDHKSGWLIAANAKALADSLNDAWLADSLWDVLANVAYIQLEIPVLCHPVCPICLVKPEERLPRLRREWLRPPGLILGRSSG